MLDQRDASLSHCRTVRWPAWPVPAHSSLKRVTSLQECSSENIFQDQVSKTSLDNIFFWLSTLLKGDFGRIRCSFSSHSHQILKQKNDWVTTHPGGQIFQTSWFLFLQRIHCSCVQRSFLLLIFFSMKENSSTFGTIWELITKKKKIHISVEFLAFGVDSFHDFTACPLNPNEITPACHFVGPISINVIIYVWIPFKALWSFHPQSSFHVPWRIGDHF